MRFYTFIYLIRSSFKKIWFLETENFTNYKICEERLYMLICIVFSPKGFPRNFHSELQKENQLLLYQLNR